MARLLYAILLGLAGAGIVHICILLLIPHYASNDAWNRMALSGRDYEFETIETSQTAENAVIDTNDPFFTIAACRFDLNDGPLHVTAEGIVPFWSVSVFDQKGQNLYNFNDRNATGGTLDLAVTEPVQMVELRKELPGEFKNSIFVEADISKGMIVLRVFHPDRSWDETISQFIKQAKCAVGADALEPLQPN